MAVTFNNLVNDTGGNLDGTLMDKAELQLLLLATVAAARTDTGAVNNWAPGLDGNTYVPWNGAADVTISGLAGGVAGQIVWGKNLTAAKVMYFLHASGLSSAANQFNNIATSGATPVAPGGLFGFLHNGTAWQLFLHEQGAWITPATPTFSGGGTLTYTAVTMTIYRTYLKGRMLTIAVDFTGTVAGAGLTSLLPLPNGYLAVASWGTVVFLQAVTMALYAVTTGSNTCSFYKDLTGGGGNFPAGSTRLMGLVQIEIQ